MALIELFGMVMKALIVKVFSALHCFLMYFES